MDRCCKMASAIFSRSSSSSKRRDASPQAVDVIRSVPQNGVLPNEGTGSYKAGVWVWDVTDSPRANHHRFGGGREKRKCKSMDRNVGIFHQLSHVDSKPKMILEDDETKQDSPLKVSLQSKQASEETLKTVPEDQSSVTHKPCRDQAVGESGDSATTTRSSQSTQKPKDEEVRYLAKQMVHSIEGLIGNLNGIVGDLRQLMQQIDAVTDSIDSQTSVQNRGVQSDAVSKVPVSLNHTSTQTNTDQHYHAQLKQLEDVKQRRLTRTSASYRYSYPQYFHSPDLSTPSPPSFDPDRRTKPRSQSSNTSPGYSPSTPINLVFPSSHHQPYTHSGRTLDSAARLRHLKPSRALQVPLVFGTSSFRDPSAISSVFDRSPEPSTPFLPAESPPNPAPTLFSAYRDDKPDPVKDLDSLPSTSLKTWKEKMEWRCGSADSLTPQMDWSYLVLSDQNRSSSVGDCKGSNSSPRVVPLSPRNDLMRLEFSGQKSVSGKVNKFRLSQTGGRKMLHLGAIPGIPEHREPSESDYTNTGFTPGTGSNVDQISRKIPNTDVPLCVKENFRGCHSAQSSSDHDAQSYRNISPETMHCTVSPSHFNIPPDTKQCSVSSSRQCIGRSSLGWPRNKVLSNWPSEDLSSIGTSDNDTDDLSSPFLLQHFHYPRRSSAIESSQDKDNTGLNRTASVPETIASGGFEVRTDMDTSPESEVLACYKSQYESAMESRLEQLSSEVEGSDFSDAEADAGSDILKQSLTSLEDTGSFRYNPDLNTWTSYTMTHIDSDDVVSDSTSDVLNENYSDTGATNPGFDDVSLNFDDIGFLSLSLPTKRCDSSDHNLE